MFFSYLCNTIGNAPDMSKQITYLYNPETDSYERYYPSLGRRMISLGIYLLLSTALAVVIFFAAFFIFDSPTQENLRKENAWLRSQYNTLRRRLDASLKVMEGIRERDDNYYRVLLHMDPLSDSERYAGLDNEERYRQLHGMPYASMLTELARGLDLLDRELYVQSRSFDQLKDAAIHHHDQLRHTPAVMPVNVKNHNIASGYGYRTDPIYATVDFHNGVDFAGKEGDPVTATADGTVAEARWRGGMGYCVEIDHGYNYRTLYAHLRKMSVTKGQSVSRGQKVGEMGTTGKSTAPHLHYEVIFKGKAQNPVNYYFMDMTPDEYDAMMRRAENAGNVMD